MGARVDHGDEEIEGGIGVTHDEEQCCLLIALVVLVLRVQENLIAQGVKFQLVIHGDLSKLRNVKGGKPGTAGHEDGFGGLARDEKSRTFSSNSKRSHILRTSSRSIRLILSSIVSLAVSLKWTRTI